MKKSQEFLPFDTKKIPLPGDGGHRVYTRLKLHSPGRKSYMLMSSGAQDSSLKDFVRIQKLLKGKRIKAPEIYKTDFKKGLLLLEDLGDVTLENFFGDKGSDQALPFYFQALLELIRLQTKIKPVPPRFDKAFFMKETRTAFRRMESLFRKQANFKKPPHALKEAFFKNMEAVCSELQTVPFVFCHRDFHSRNLMLKRKQIRMIDFQDGGTGPFCYDLTSLFYDSYVFLNEQTQRKLLNFYLENQREAFRQKIGDLKKVLFFIQLQFLQRGFKACGCFAGFFVNDSKATHLKYIPKTLKRLERIAEKLSYKGLRDYFRFSRKRFLSLKM